MLIIPAVDLRHGRCVRLKQGRAEEETVYSENPVEMARKWVFAGSNRLHVIDLDGALSGQSENLEIVLKIKRETNVFIQMGGGLRDLESIGRVLSSGLDRVILGTIAFEESGVALQAFEQYKNRIMVALDVDQGVVATRGWKGSSGIPLMEALAITEKLGCQEIIYTDIRRDGMMQGVNARDIETVMAQTKMTVYASGGVSSLEDVKRLKAIQSPGCVIGKALYDGKLDLKEAIDVASA